MKFNKIFSALLGVAAVVGMASCSEDVSYVPAEKTPGAYFPVTNVVTYKLSDKGGSLNFTVGRFGNLAAETVSLTNNFDELKGSNFTMPASVTFAEGDEFTSFTVNYDGETLPPATYKINIGFGAGVAVSQYGYANLEITATLPEPAPVVPWIDLGEVTFADPFVTCGLFTTMLQDQLKYKVHLEQSGSEEGVYRFVHPYGTAFAKAFAEVYGEELEDSQYDSKDEMYLTFNAADPKVAYIPLQSTGVCLFDEDGPIYGMSYNYYIMATGGTPSSSQNGTFVNGVLRFPKQTLLVAFPEADDPEVADGLYYGNAKAAMKCVFPGVVAGDYSVEVEYMGQFNNISNGVAQAVASATFGPDVYAAKAGIVNASVGSELAAGLSDGSVEGININIKDPVFSFPVYTSGTYTIVVVTFDDSGEPQETSDVTVEIDPFDNDDKGWNDLGEATIADGWIWGGFGAETDQEFMQGIYSAPVQESVNVAGLYRIKNMWGPENPLGSYSSTLINTAFYIDATDTEFIKITPQFTGWTYGNFGSVYAFNWEGYLFDNGYTKEDVVEADRITTSLEDGMIEVNSPLICGTGPAFSSGWGAYRGYDYSLILLPDSEDGEEPSAVAAKIKSAAQSATVKASVKSNRKFQSKFQIAPVVKNNGRANKVTKTDLRFDRNMFAQ